MTDATASLSAIYTRSSRMVGRRIGGQFVLVPIARDVAEVDSLYTLNALGTFLWDRFDGTRDGNAHVSAVVQRFDVTTDRAEEDYLTFVGHLLAVRALEEVPARP
jgi:hypothetical protein